MCCKMFGPLIIKLLTTSPLQLINTHSSLILQSPPPPKKKERRKDLKTNVFFIKKKTCLIFLIEHLQQSKVFKEGINVHQIRKPQST